ncbi:uncharacterized protein LOC126820451 [Patella vulgata]|uniref:uncharacterized protein LOC126820451 n=1 Tax=Patella vulgata TaxID=6465 RepID=UPI0024A9B6ED|nr:uncharacterized protein LOC126820451 [Patella vulgata]
MLLEHPYLLVYVCMARFEIMASMLNSFLALVLLDTVMVVVADSVYGCYEPEDSLCSKKTLTCPVGRRIRIEGMHYYSKPHTIKCPKLQDEEDCRTSPCCSYSTGDVHKRSSKEDLLHAFKNCTYRQACTISPPYRLSTGYSYVKYGYSCMRESDAFHIMTGSKVSRDDGYDLYFSGKDSPVKELTCSCDITSDGGNIYMYNWITYLNGESCTRLTVTEDDQPVYTCNDDGVFTGFNGNTGPRGLKYRILFNNMTSSYDDVIWIRFYGTLLTVSCDCNKAAMSGGWSDWSYTNCSESCGVGTSSRTRKCNNPAPTNGGDNCTGSSTEPVACYQQACSATQHLHMKGLGALVTITSIWCATNKHALELIYNGFLLVSYFGHLCIRNNMIHQKK